MLVGVGDDFEHVYGRLNLSVIVRSRMEKDEGDTFWIGEGGAKGELWPCVRFRATIDSLRRK